MYAICVLTVVHCILKCNKMMELNMNASKRCYSSYRIYQLQELFITSSPGESYQVEDERYCSFLRVQQLTLIVVESTESI